MNEELATNQTDKSPGNQAVEYTMGRIICLEGPNIDYLHDIVWQIESALRPAPRLAIGTAREIDTHTQVDQRPGQNSEDFNQGDSRLSAHTLYSTRAALSMSQTVSQETIPPSRR